MDCLRAIAPVAVGAIVIASGGVLHAQAIQAGSDPRKPAVQTVSELPDGSVPPVVTVHLTTVLPLLGAPFTARSPEDAPDRRVAARMFGMVAAVDWATTAHSLAFHHGYEENPVINWAPTPATTIAVGAAIDVAAMALWERLTRDHPRTATVGLYLAAGARLFLAGRNEYRIAHAGTCTTPLACQSNCIEVLNRCR
jgi:hypothetical protein